MDTPPGHRRSNSHLAGLALCLLVAVTAVAEDPSGSPESTSLPPRYQRWVEEVDLLLTGAEREIFFALKEDYQRDNFIRRFWKVRDPFLTTARNEFQDLWVERVAAARQEFDDLKGERARMMLTFGAPSRRRPMNCSVLRPLEVWEYDGGNERIRGFFTLVFLGLPASRGPHDLWQPYDGVRKLFDFTSRVSTSNDSALAQKIAQDCVNGGEILSALSQALDISRTEAQATLLPQPSDEWVKTFAARSTDVPEGAETLNGDLAISYPGRHQSRTVVQGLVAVPAAELELAAVGEHRSYNLLVDGEILRKGELFDQFRYRFRFPDDRSIDRVPVVVQRYLRPGPYRLILKVEDMESKRIFRDERALEVPRVEKTLTAAVRGTPDRGLAERAAAPDGTGPAESPDRATPALASADRPTAPVATTAANAALRRVAERLGEANASISTGDHTIKILALPDILTVGRLRVEARARGEGIAKVSFALNGRLVMKKSKPPYSVELDLGDEPRFHTLRVAALDAEGRELANDEVMVNAGPHRFSVRLLEPRHGKAYRSSVRAHAEVEVPEGERLDRVEFFLNETLVATLFQPPFEQPLLFDEEEEVSYVRVVGYLVGGDSTEDVRFINAPDYVDELDVQFVELYVTVLDRRGNFIEDLELAEVEVAEDGIPQDIRRFETMRDLPIRAGLVLDTSLSMADDLSQVKKAAYRFLETVLTERDRAALFVFNDEPQLVVRFTPDKEILAGGLAELVAEGETALYDSIIYSLHYFSGLKGKRAIIVLTDGEDSTSSYNYEEAAQFARRTGVAIYVIGLNLSSSDADTRLRMRRLASETGGEVFLIDSAGQLGGVYADIQRELRSQYLIAYQSSQQDTEDRFRRVEVKLSRRGLEAKTIRGYFP
jgi:VWFA-related protein